MHVVTQPMLHQMKSHPVRMYDRTVCAGVQALLCIWYASGCTNVRCCCAGVGAIYVGGSAEGKSVIKMLHLKNNIRIISPFTLP